MADMITGEEISKLMNAFNAFADKYNHTIGTPELTKVLRKLGHSPTEAEVQEVLTEWK